MSLKAILGEVIVRATPADAELFVDGRSRGAAKQTLRLPATAHVIEIRKPGYVTHKATVTPRAGLPQNIEVTLLEGVAAAPRARPPPAIRPAKAAAPAAAAAPAIVALVPTLRAARTGQELKLVPAGSFHDGQPAARGRAARQRGATPGQPAAALLRLDARGHECRLQASSARDHRSGFVGQNTLELDRQPVVNVSWQDAAAYLQLAVRRGRAHAGLREARRQLVAVVAA